MTNAVIESIVNRSSTKYYDPAATLSDDQIRALERNGSTAPTSPHPQSRRFIAVRTPDAKARLRPIAWNQPAISEAATAGWRIPAQYHGSTRHHLRNGTPQMHPSKILPVGAR